jgi:FAD/FMN-containing dehydrogenase
MFAGAHHSSSTQWVVHPGILSESKTILPESDLILFRRIPAEGMDRWEKRDGRESWAGWAGWAKKFCVRRAELAAFWEGRLAPLAK